MTSNGLFQHTHPTDLRGASPLEAGGGKIYPVDPQAAQRLREFHEQRDRERAAKAVEESAAMQALAAQLKRRKKMTAKPITTTTTQPAPAADDATALYSAEVRAAAAVEMAKSPRKRRYDKVFTPEVLDIWQGWLDEGKTPEWIAENNGLISTTHETVRSRLKKHSAGKTAVSNKPPKPPKMAAPEPEPPPVAEPAVIIEPAQEIEVSAAQETAVSEPAPAAEPEPAQNGRFVATKPDNLPAFLDRDNRPAPRPLDGLAALLQLVQSDQVKVRGSVKLNLNLEVDFGE